MPPDSTIARHQIEGSKKDKTRITIAMTCNADDSDRFIPNMQHMLQWENRETAWILVFQ